MAAFYSVTSLHTGCSVTAGGHRGRCVAALYLSHLLDLGASFPDQGAALAGRHHESQRDGGLTGGRTVAHGVDDVLEDAWSERHRSKVTTTFWMSGLPLKLGLGS